MFLSSSNVIACSKSIIFVQIQKQIHFISQHLSMFIQNRQYATIFSSFSNRNKIIFCVHQDNTSQEKRNLSLTGRGQYVHHNQVSILPFQKYFYFYFHLPEFEPETKASEQKIKLILPNTTYNFIQIKSILILRCKSQSFYYINY